jgi:FkbM family methyltransferase
MIHHGGTIENETFWNGLFKTFENDTGWVWTELCVISNVIFDIGANTGIYSLVAKTIHNDSKVYSFEPSNHTYTKLQQNNLVNKFDIICEQIALSSHTGEQTFFDTPDHNQTSASLSPKKLKEWSGYSGDIVEYKVKTMTLADYIEINNIKKIDLIKLDIEMHEPEAIKGLGKYLMAFKPIIIIEVLSQEVANELNNIIPLDNFDIFHLKEEKVAIKQKSFSVNPGLWNYIIIHKDLTNMVKQQTTGVWLNGE